MLHTITPTIILNDAEFTFSFIRAPGPGGQNVNKVATAVQLRFDVLHSRAFTEEMRQRILKVLKNKINADGELMIKATNHRTQERNKQEAIARAIALLQYAVRIQKKRKKTKPSFASQQKRLQSKKKHGAIKSLRGHKISHE